MKAGPLAAAVLLGLCVVCHIIPAIFAVAATVIAVALRPDRSRLRWALTAGVVGAALTGFWTVPFVLRRPYLNDMGWEKKHQLLVLHLLGRRMVQQRLRRHLKSQTRDLHRTSALCLEPS